jgi:hypothetical protein
VVRVDNEDVLFEVTVGASVKAPGTPQRTNTSLLQLTNGIYVQNIDIYIDTDGADGTGFASCIPGRRIAFAEGRTWERAVVLTPQPASARAVVAGAMPEAAPFVSFPGPLLVRGRTIIARVPMAQLGGRPQATWGWSVQLSGAAWERNFNLVDTVKGSAAPDALTLPVRTTAERWAFGGSSGGRAHPQVVDVLVPAGSSQHQVLSTFNDDTGSFARVPFAYGRPPPSVATSPDRSAAPPSPPPASPPAPSALPLTVADISSEIVTIEGPTTGLRPMMIGSVLAHDGSTVARVVLVQVMPKGVVATALEHQERIAPGAIVRFGTAASSATSAP